MVGDRAEPIGDDGVEPVGEGRAEPMVGDRAGVLVTVGDRAEPVTLGLLRGFVGFRAFLGRRGEASQGVWQAPGRGGVLSVSCLFRYTTVAVAPPWALLLVLQCLVWRVQRGHFHFVPCRATHATVGDRGCH